VVKPAGVDRSRDSSSCFLQVIIFIGFIGFIYFLPMTMSKPPHPLKPARHRFDG